VTPSSVATTETVVFVDPNFSTHAVVAAMIRCRASSSVRGGFPCQP
jgi:hypothetical protein